MPFSDNTLQTKRPSSIRSVQLPRQAPFRITDGQEVPYYPSPVDWASEVLHFLLPDWFSDDQDPPRPPFNRSQAPSTARPSGFRWDQWAESGKNRWQGGTIQGIASRLDYLADLGITAVWIESILKQRKHADKDLRDTYHGYGVQDFLEVDPHFGTRDDLVNLVIAAH